MPVTPEEIVSYKPILMGLLPPTGAPIGNIRARRQLQESIQTQHGQTITDDDYWTIRDALWNDGIIGIGGGRGGSIYLIIEEPVIPPDNRYAREDDLYEPILGTLSDSWVKDFFIEDFIYQNTAHQGGRDTGGKWTRPDLVLVAVRIYPFIPGKSVELFSFEVKPLGAYGIQGVFETASHSAFAHRSYLMIHVPPGFNDRTVLDRLDAESKRFGVGFYTFEDPENYESYELRVEPRLQTPPLFTINDFLKRQLNDQNKARLKRLIH